MRCKIMMNKKMKQPKNLTEMFLRDLKLISKIKKVKQNEKTNVTK